MGREEGFHLVYLAPSIGAVEKIMPGWIQGRRDYDGSLFLGYPAEILQLNGRD